MREEKQVLPIMSWIRFVWCPCAVQHKQSLIWSHSNNVRLITIFFGSYSGTCRLYVLFEIHPTPLNTFFPLVQSQKPGAEHGENCMNDRRLSCACSGSSTCLRSCWSSSTVQSSTTSITVWFSLATKQDKNRLQQPPSRTCTPPESGGEQGKSLQTLHFLDTTSSNFNSSEAGWLVTTVMWCTSSSLGFCYIFVLLFYFILF